MEGQHRTGPVVSGRQVVEALERIGRYDVVGRIGSGGFATVYRVRDSVLDSEVAAKVLAENWTDNAELRDRFMREAQLLRRIDSHRVVTVHDIGELPSGQPYFVMSLANRGTLEGRLAQFASPSQDEILNVADEVADCVRAVHHHDLIHRDIKPSNLLITGGRSTEGQAPTSVLSAGERLLLGDFGLAKDVALQATGMTIAAGTGGYAAPEQMNPQGAPDRRTDLYATTAVMYRVISGTIPPGFDLVSSRVPLPDHEWWMTGALGAFFRRGMGYGQHERHGSIDEWLAEFRSAYGSTQTAPGQGQTHAATQWAGPSAPSGPTSGPTSGPGSPSGYQPPVHDPNSDPTRSLPVHPQTGQPQAYPQTGYPQTGQPQAYPQTGRPQTGQPQVYPQTGYPQTGQPQAYPQTGQPHYQAPHDPTSGPPSGPPYGSPYYGQADPRSGPASAKKSRWPVVLVAATILAAVVGAGAYVALQGQGPVINGPTNLAAGELEVFSASYEGADSFRWTDWNGDVIDEDEFEVRAIAPGRLTFSVVALTNGSESVATDHTLTITEAPDGPQIVGPDRVQVGQTQEFTYQGEGRDPRWIDPTGNVLEGDTYRITPRGAGSWSLTLIVTRNDGTQVGTRREITLYE